VRPFFTLGAGRAKLNIWGVGASEMQMCDILLQSISERKPRWASKRCSMSRTTNLHEALAQSRSNSENTGFIACAQSYAHQRHLIVCCDSSNRWILIIDEVVFPTTSLVSIERIFGSGNLQIPLSSGWLSQAPRNFSRRLEAIRQAIKGQSGGGLLPVIVPAERGRD
jgi:hypothetical protein